MATVQIHELTEYIGTPTSSDYLVVDDGAETVKVNAKGLGFVDIDTGNFNLDTTAESGDDYDLTQALTALNWLNDVIV